MPRTEEYLINIGPQHPSTHGVLRLLTKLDGETIVKCEPEIGYLHRGIEKICENRTYLQCIPFTDRVDYLASMNCNFAFVNAVEKLAGIEVPERAEYIRIIMAELNRIASHLVWFGAMNLDLGSFTPFLYGFREREQIISLFERTAGQRLLYNFFRIGGVKNDLPEGFIEKTRVFLEDFRSKLKDYCKLVTKNIIFQTRMKGIGIIPQKMAEAWGVSGPVLRASGIKYDVRKNEPYSIYPRFKFEIPFYSEGDAFARYLVRLDEMRQSVEIIEQALRQIPDGPILNKQSFLLKVKEGEGYFRTEAPRGEMGIYLVSDGSEKPYRVKFRTASFANLQILPQILPGRKVADLVAILGSLDLVLPAVDR